MNPLTGVLNFGIKSATRLICQVDDSELKVIPERGPLIIVSNHINFLDVPVLYTHLLPRPMTGYAKIETWDNPILGKLFDVWGAIPLRRGEADKTALRSVLSALQIGKIIGIAPEGTRSGSGTLGRGFPGVITIALHSGAPLLPVGFYGGEKFRTNISSLRKTNFYIRVGEPFYIDPGNEKISRELRRRIVDEIMYQIARLLPSEYRGYYYNLDSATEKYLKFISFEDLQTVTTQN